MRVDCSITENYFKERNRMTKNECGKCHIECIKCPISSYNSGLQYGCGSLERMSTKKAIEIVQKWSDEHQEMTNLDYLLEHFPNTKLDEDGTPAEICPDSIGLPLADGMVCKGNAVDCKKCWSRLYEEK